MPNKSFHRTATAADELPVGHKRGAGIKLGHAYLS